MKPAHWLACAGLLLAPPVAAEEPPTVALHAVVQQATTAAALSADGALAAVGGDEGVVQLWNLDTAAPERTWRFAHPVAGLAFSPDGARVAVRDDEGAVALVTVATGERADGGPLDGEGWMRWPDGEAAPTLGGDPPALDNLPQGHRVLAVGADGRVALLDGGSAPLTWFVDARRPGATLAPVGEPIVALDVTSDGAVTVGRSGRLTRWSLSSGQPALDGTIGPDPSTVAWAEPVRGRVVSGSATDAATAWNTARGAPLHRFSGHTGDITHIEWDPSGTTLLTAGDDGTVRAWDAQLGTPEQVVSPHDGAVVDFALAVRGGRVATVGADGVVSSHRLRQGRLAPVASLSGVQDPTAVAWARGGGRLAFGSADGRITTWDGASSEAESTRGGLGGPVRDVAFGPGGGRLAVAVEGGGVKVLQSSDLSDAAVGHLAEQATALAFSPDTNALVIGTPEGRIKAFDLSGAAPVEVASWRAQSAPIRELSFSEDGERLLSIAEDRPMALWRGLSGKRLRVGGAVRKVHGAVSRDGSAVASLAPGGALVVHDGRKYRDQRSMRAHDGPARAVDLRADGEAVLTGGDDGRVLRWAGFREDGAPVPSPRFGLQAAWRVNAPVVQVAFDPSGEGGVALLETPTLAVLPADSRAIEPIPLPERGRTLALSPDGATAAVGHETRGVSLVDLDGRAVSIIDGTPGPTVTSLAWSGDGHRLAMGLEDGRVLYRDMDADTAPVELTAHLDAVTALGFDDQGRLWSASEDQTVQVWTAASKPQPMVRMLSMQSGSYVVLDPDGRFDADHEGQRAASWILGGEAITLSQVAESFYDPGLLHKSLLAGADGVAPVRDVPGIEALGLTPEIAVEPIRPRARVLRFTLTDRGGGIGPVTVTLNGSDISSLVPEPEWSEDRSVARYAMSLRGLDYYDPLGANTVVVKAFNRDGSVSSRGLDVDIEDRRSRRIQGPPPAIWGVVIGSHDYADDELDLLYPGKDARAMHTALRLAASKLYAPDDIHLTLLTTVEGDEPPTRQNIVAAFEELRQARPGDVVVVYLAGHGVTHTGGGGTDYYYLTVEMGPEDSVEDKQSRDDVMLSGRSIQRMLLASPAAKRVLILDTCHSGQLVEAFGSSTRAAPAGQALALERMKDKTGTYVLAGAQASQFSYEASRYGQGVLTYALLQGMQGAALDGDFVDISQLFEHARQQVPLLAKGVGGAQTPVIKMPTTGSFPIGLLPIEVRDRVPVSAERPVVVQSVFSDAKTGQLDPIRSSKLDERLRAHGAEDDARFAFFRQASFPGAHKLAVSTLDVGDDGTRVVAALERDGLVVGGFELTHPRDDSHDELADALYGALVSWFGRGAPPIAESGERYGNAVVLNPQDTLKRRSSLVEGDRGADQSKLMRRLTRRSPCIEHDLYRIDLKATVDAARLAYNQDDPALFDEYLGQVEDVLGCMGEELTADDAKALHRLYGLRTYAEVGPDAALPYFRESPPLALELEQGADEDEHHEYRVLADLSAEILQAGRPPTERLPPSAKGKVVANAAANPDVAEGHPYVFQRYRNGRVFDTQYVHPTDPRPAYPKLRTALAITAGSTAAATAGAIVGAVVLHDQLVGDNIQRESEAQLVRKTTWNNALVIGSAVTGTVSAASAVAWGLSWTW